MAEEYEPQASTLRISTRDVGLTQVATVWIGSTRITEFHTATKHEHSSIGGAEQVVAHALRPLLEAAIEEDRFATPWKGKPGGDIWED